MIKSDGLYERLEDLFDHLEWLSTRPKVKDRAKGELSNFKRDFYRLDLSSSDKIRRLVEKYDVVVDRLYGEL